MFQIDVGYPTAAEEIRIAAMSAGGSHANRCASSSAQHVSSSCRISWPVFPWPSTSWPTRWPSAAPTRPGPEATEMVRIKVRRVGGWPARLSAPSCSRPRRAPCSTVVYAVAIDDVRQAGRAGARSIACPQFSREADGIKAARSHRCDRRLRRELEGRGRRTFRPWAPWPACARRIGAPGLAGGARPDHRRRRAFRSTPQFGTPALRSNSTEHKEYAPGDDIRRIDWKAVARTESLTRSSASRTRPRCARFSCSTRPHRWAYRRISVSKLEYASYLAAALAYLVRTAARRRRVARLCRRHEALLPPSTRPGQARELFTALENLQPTGAANASRAIDLVGEICDKRSLIFIFSDLLDCEDDPGESLAARGLSPIDCASFALGDTTSCFSTCSTRTRSSSRSTI